jgi:hypothetical protein
MLAYVVPDVLMLLWQLQAVPIVTVPLPKPVGMVMLPGWPDAVDGGKPWQLPQAAAEIVVGRKAMFQVGVLFVPVVSPPDILAP